MFSRLKYHRCLVVIAGSFNPRSQCSHELVVYNMAAINTISSLCRCADRPAVHVHCFCFDCNGKAVNYRTQIAHMKLNAVGDLQSSVYESNQFENHGKLKYTFNKLYLIHTEQTSFEIIQLSAETRITFLK